MNNDFTIINNEGRVFRLVIINHGDKYGLNNCLTFDDTEYNLGSMVEFWDMGSKDKPKTGSFAETGQFVSRYYISTLLEDQSFTGLCLDGGVPVWSIDAPAMVMVYRYLNTMTDSCYRHADSNGNDGFSANQSAIDQRERNS